MRICRWTVVPVVAFAAAIVAATSVARGQTVTVSGVVVRGDQGTPVSRANVRITEGPSTTTDETGRFRLADVSPGRAALVVQAVGYRLQILDLTLDADTTLRIRLEPLPTQLDTVRTIAGNVTITGRVRDSATKARVLMGEVTAYPGARTVGILTAGFRVTDVPRGDVTLVVTGFQHLPATISFNATRDTSLVVDLVLDSVALRMTAQQVKRLGERAQAVPIAQEAHTGEEVRSSGALSVGEFVGRQLMQGHRSSRTNRATGDACVFYDDEKVADDRDAAKQVLQGIPLETLERVEIYGTDGQMIRIYSKQYVADLARERRLPRIVYMAIGLRIACQ